ncbi:maestro heat-like repeat-containing protein family member 1-like protein [Amazona aestiva]|uniref:Maestro heat-like repeat-containing protein family member 1-like protein n=1 Tax=Amazona aestiva TaxID=12930 RepID=A0A0Q3MQZ8_AMAAE|nr:maestro heat-like repeat-containing protein family member 1-like protein [Amazona aestiva]
MGTYVVLRELHGWERHPGVRAACERLLQMCIRDRPEDLPEEDMERLPPDLQYLPPDKQREEEPDIRRMLLEAIMLLAYPHRVIILKAMETVVRNNIALLDKSTAKVVIFLASNEMTKSKRQSLPVGPCLLQRIRSRIRPCPQEVIRDWQEAASSVLVAVGQRFINKVMEEVLTKFQPGILPHYFVLQTFANLSVSNGEAGTCPPRAGAALGGVGPVGPMGAMG